MRFWLFLSPKLYSQSKTVNRSIKQCYSFSTIGQCRPYPLPLLRNPQRYSIDGRILIHSNPTNNDHSKKQPSKDTLDNERKIIEELLESCARRVVKQIESSGDVSSFTGIAEREFQLGNYGAAIKTYELLVNQTFQLDWLPYWQMCLGDCYKLIKPPLRDLSRAWHHYECALTKYPEQLTLDIMIRVIYNSLGLLEELNASTRAIELCAQTIDASFKSQDKGNQHASIAYKMFDHVRTTYLCKKTKETDEVLFHASKALTLYKQQRKNGSLVKTSNNEDLKTIIKWTAEICIAEKEYDTALIHLYELVDVLAGEDEELSYDYLRHPSFRVSVNSMIGSVFRERNMGEWRKALMHYHAALYNLRLCIKSASKTEGQLHFYMTQIWLDQKDAQTLAAHHANIAGMIMHLNENIITYPPINILLASPQRAQQYERLAICYDSQLAFDKLGIVAKAWAVNYASMAMLLYKGTSESSDHLSRLQSFIGKISQKNDLRSH